MGMVRVALWSFTVGLISTASCTESSDGPAGTDHPTPANAAAPVKTELNAYAEATLAIGNLLRADAIVWPELKAQLKTASPHIAAIDLKHKTEYGKEIPRALQAIESGEMVEVNKHITTKGLQHVSVLTLRDLQEELLAGDVASASATVDKIEIVLAAIAPTFNRRDNTVYGGKPTLMSARTEALTRLRAADSKTSLASAAMNFSRLLTQTYALSVLYEMKGVEQFCHPTAPDPDRCAIKRTEARIYYRIIEPAVAARNKKIDSNIEEMINSPKAVPKYAAVRDMLAETLPFSAEELTF